MLAGTFSLAPRIFDLRISRDSLTARVAAFFDDAAITAFPGLGSTLRSAVAVFAYSASPEGPARSVAMPLERCAP